MNHKSSPYDSYTIFQVLEILTNFKYTCDQVIIELMKF